MLEWQNLLLAIKDKVASCLAVYFLVNLSCRVLSEATFQAVFRRH